VEGRLKQEYLAAGEPVVSIDTKKKELLGRVAARHPASPQQVERGCRRRSKSAAI